MFCDNCGEKLANGKKFCSACGQKVEGTSQSAPRESSQRVEQSYQREQKKKKHPLVIVGQIMGGFFLLSFVMALFAGGDSSESTPTSSNSGSSSGNTASENNSTPAEPSKTPLELELEYKQACNYYDYSTIFRDSSKYVGEKATVTGEVVQILYDGDYCGFRINVTDGTYYSEDTMWGEYQSSSDESRILEGDMLTIYGELNELYTYEAVMGNQITIPAITVKYVENITTSTTPSAPLENTSYGQTEIQPIETIGEMDFYSSVIQSYRTAMELGYGFEQLEEVDLNYLAGYYKYDEIAAAIFDVDGNGIRELFIGAIQDDGRFFDMYTIENNTLILVARNGERDSYALCDDLLFFYSGSNSAFDTEVGTFALEGSKMTPITYDSKDYDSVEYALPYQLLDSYLT